jgi:LysM repeat protein
MNNKRRGLQVVILLLISALLVSACEQSLSSAPVATPTQIEGLFVSPFPAAENPMALIEEFARQTAAAQTATAGGDPLEDVEGLETAIATLDVDAVETPTPDLFASTPTNAEPAATADTAVPAATAVPPGTRPATYTLQRGEWPWCIARRYNADPNELLRLSGLTVAQANSLMVGTVLTIPQSGSFPGPRNLLTRPATHTVASGETIYGIACKFGDIEPATIASANNISVSSPLTVGQQLQIP